MTGGCPNGPERAAVAPGQQDTALRRRAAWPWRTGGGRFPIGGANPLRPQADARDGTCRSESRESTARMSSHEPVHATQGGLQTRVGCFRPPSLQGTRQPSRPSPGPCERAVGRRFP